MSVWKSYSRSIYNCSSLNGDADKLAMEFPDISHKKLWEKLKYMLLIERSLSLCFPLYAFLEKAKFWRHIKK